LPPYHRVDVDVDVDPVDNLIDNRIVIVSVARVSLRRYECSCSCAHGP
jgi:hypothetical protein